MDSRYPIRYYNGAVMLTETDLSVPNGGYFGHRRSYGNQASAAYDGPNGFNWFVDQLPYVVSSGSGSSTSVAVVFDANNPYWFSKSGTTYTAMYGVVGVTLTEDTVAKTLTLTVVSGGIAVVTVFNSLSAATDRGQFVSQTDARGVTTSVTSRSGGRINEMQRSHTVSGTTTVESLVYSYYSSGPAANSSRCSIASRWAAVHGLRCSRTCTPTTAHPIPMGAKTISRPSPSNCRAPPGDGTPSASPIIATTRRATRSASDTA